MAVRVEQHAEPLPGYRLIDRLGGGGFGEVWRAVAPGGMHKAIKFVFGDLSAAGETGQRADQELKALKRVLTVRHPFILSLERYDIIDGQLLIVMELADRSMWDRFKECRSQGGPGIPRDELLRYMEESAEALDLMNQEYQLQHLDIKPQNIFLVGSHVKVADFGLVKVLEGSQASVTGGLTPVYAAPETFDGKVSRFSDQYSFAILYQEMLTGQRPFNGTNVRQLIMQHISGVPDVSPLPAGERDVIARALSKVPEQRFPTCREMVSLLRGAVSSAPSITPSSRLEAEQVTVRPSDPSVGSGPLTWQNVTPPASSPLTANLRQPAVEVPVTPAPTPSSSHQATRFVRSSEQPAPPPAAPPAEATGAGCLFPALLLGIGQTGLEMLQRARNLLDTQAAPLYQLPCVRSLLIDSDPEISRLAQRDGSPAALSPHDILLAPLSRPSHYQKAREGRPSLEAWLNMRLVYRIPRSLVTTGIRALGRLAFLDNHRLIVRRLQAELEAVTDPASLQMAARATQLGMRTNRPRVYLFAGLAGGTGSGMFLDAAYTVRALLKQMGYEHPDVVGVFLVPPLDGKRTRTMAQGNAYAALAELDYYGKAGHLFEAHYADRSPPLRDDAPPFSRTVILPLPEEGDEVATGEVLELVGQFLLRDVASPMGKMADLARAGMPAPPWDSRGRFFSTLGFFQLSWPRQALLSAAGRKLCVKIVQRWLSKDSKPIRDRVQGWVKQQWADRELGADRFIERLQEAATRASGRDADDAFAAITGPLRPASSSSEQGTRSRFRAPVQPVAQTAEQLAAALHALEELIGAPGDDPPPAEPPPLLAVLAEEAERLSNEWSQKLAELAVHLIEQPAFRLAGAEEAIRQAIALLEQALQVHEPLAADLAKHARDARDNLWMLAAPKPGQKKPPFTPSEVYDLIRAYPRWRHQSLVLGHLSATFVALRGHLSDELREIGYCRVRLSELQRMFEEVPPEETSLSAQGNAAQQGGIGRRVFVSGCQNLREAVELQLRQLPPDHLFDLDGCMQATLRNTFGALVNVCLTKQNQLKDVQAALLQTAREYMTEHEPATSAAQLFFEQHPEDEEAESEVAEFYSEAAPEQLLSRSSLGGAAPAELCVLAAPDDEAGQRLRTLLARVEPDAEVHPVISRDDVVVYRERFNLPLSALPHLGPEGHNAAMQMASADFSPHSRSDVDFSR